MLPTLSSITKQIDSIVDRAIADADEYLAARSELNGKIATARMIYEENGDGLSMIESTFTKFDAKHALFAEVMRGAYDSKNVLRTARRYLTPPGESRPMSITPYSAEVFVSDWNGFDSLFDGNVEYADVTPAVRDVLLALTYAPSAVAYGSTLCLTFSLSDGRFTTMMEGGRVDVLSGRCWASLVDVARAKRMKKSARGAGCVLWTLLHHHGAKFEDGELVLDTDISDALRRAHNPAIRSGPAARNLTVRVRPSGRVGVVKR